MHSSRETSAQSGDFLIELDQPTGLEIDIGFSFALDINKMGELSSQAVKDALPEAAFHAMIFNKSVAEGKPIAEIFHSADGYRFKGVKTNDLLAEKILAHKEGYRIGQIVVLRPHHPKMNAEIARAAGRWATVDYKKVLGLNAKATQEDVRTAMESKHGIPLPTRYTFQRNKDHKDVLALFELYRAFRAHYRNSQNPPEPLSKSKGASCSSFAFTIFKIAIINVFFPPGLITRIKVELEALNQLKKKKGLTKLRQLGPQIVHFTNILKMVNDFANDKQLNESDSEFQNRKKHIAALSHRIKGFNIDNFCKYVIRSGLCDVAGYLYLKEAATPDGVSVMDHVTLQKLLKLRKTETAALVVSREELALLAGSDLSQAEKGFFGGREPGVEVKSSPPVRPKIAGGDSDP